MRAGLQVLGLPIVDESGQHVGTVADMLFDDECRRVIGLVMHRRQSRSRRSFVEFDVVRAIRDDVVIAAVDLRRASRVAVNRPVQGKTVISNSGRYVGTIRDVYFDENTGDVCGYEVSPSAGTAATALLPSRVPIMGDVLVVEDEATE